MVVFRWTPEFHDQQFRETFGVVELNNTKRNEHIDGGNEYRTEESGSVDCVPEATHSDSEDTVASPVKCETSKLRPSVGISCSGFSGLSSAPYENTGREWNYGSKSTSEAADLACETLSQPLYALSIVERHETQKSGPPIEVQHSSYRGYPTVTFPRNYGESSVSDYKLTLIGNFSYRRLKMKEIRADFRAQNRLNGQVKIRHCTYRQVLLLFTNEEDYYSVLYKKMFVVAGSLMQISWSSSDFHHEAKQNIHPDFRLSDAVPVNWNIDTSKLHPFVNGLPALAIDEKPMSLQLPAMSRFSSVPSLHSPVPLSANSASMASQLCAQSYLKGIMGSPIFGRNEQAVRGSTFSSPSKALDRLSLAQQHNQLDLYKEPNVTYRIAKLQPPSTTSVSDTTSSIQYRECLKNHAASMGGHAVDGYGEFMPSREEGTPGALKCAACNCHQNFHRKEIDDHLQMDDVESHSTFSQLRNNSYSPSSLVNSLQPYSQPPSPKSGQRLERIEPSSILPSFSYEMENRNTIQIGKQWEYSSRDNNRSTSRDHPSIRIGNRNFDLFKPLNNRSPDEIPLEFPACPSRCQSQSVYTDEFPHLDIINNLLCEEHGTGRT